MLAPVGELAFIVLFVAAVPLTMAILIGRAWERPTLERRAMQSACVLFAIVAWVMAAEFMLRKDLGEGLTSRAGFTFGAVFFALGCVMIAFAVVLPPKKE